MSLGGAFIAQVSDWPPRPIVVSLALHALVLALAADVAWNAIEPRFEAPTHVLWLTDLPRPSIDLPVEPETEVAPSEAAPAAVIAPLEPERSVAPEIPAVPIEPAPEPASSEALPEANRQPYVDFEAIRAQAIDEVMERQARERTLRKPTVEELMRAAEPEEQPKRPARSIFTPGPNRSPPSIARPGQARTKLGRKLADFCHALTGGFGVGMFGRTFFTACAKNDAGPTGLFPEVMPEYLKLKPDCAEVMPLGPVLPEASLYPTVKCRLVPKTDAIERTP